jgi:aspartyl-tRNA synthetase
MCGTLRPSDAGRKAVLMGWVNRRRDLGSIIFIDLRDRTGVTQVVFNREHNATAHDRADSLRNEYVIAAIGTVKLRDSDTVNKNIPTGEVELVADEIRILNESKLPPFLPSDAALTNEETRLKYRYIDLRRDVMQFNIETRHKVSKAIRDYLSSQGFFEIETPFMTRSTPEGARDYLVPSRVQPGTFYALPQSPQLFKQILMIAGFDKYFQIVRCFRDEDFRADRQAEFTQIDLEMSFPQAERVWEVVEGFLAAAFKAAGFEIKPPFPRMDYDEAIRLYGIDKPDLRLPPFTDVRDCFAAENLAELGINANLPVIGIRTPRVGELSRKERDDIKPLFHAKGGAKIFEDFKRIANKFPEAAAAIAKKTAMEEGDLIVLVAGSGGMGETFPHRKVTPLELAIYTSAGLLRVALAQKYADRHKCFQRGDFRFLWVTNFPMFEWDENEQQWMAAHHPFTSPHEKDMALLETGVESGLNDPNSPLSAVRALAYDVVLNGTELGSGSIRIHRQDIQRKIFRALGMTEEEAKSRFGFFLEALEYGTPPHGGIALGLDRIVMILAGAESLREVIPFPKTARAVDLMVDAPTPVPERQLRELGIRIAQPRGMTRDERRMPDVPTPDFVGAMCEIWFTVSYVAYHLAYVKVYLQTRAMQTRVAVLRQDEQALKDLGQADLIVCRTHLASFFWQVHHVFEAIEAAINRGKKEHPDQQYFYAWERWLGQIRQSPIPKEIEAYRNEGHNIPAIIGQRWDRRGKFLGHFLPSVKGCESKDSVELGQQLQVYFEYVANLWLHFVPEPHKSKFPRNFSYSVTIPSTYLGELPAELQGDVRQLQVSLEAFERPIPEVDMQNDSGSQS